MCQISGTIAALQQQAEKAEAANEDYLYNGRFNKIGAKFVGWVPVERILKGLQKRIW